MRTIPERVRAGIIYLRARESEESMTPDGIRKVNPELKGWPTRIDLKALDIMSHEKCVLGQLFGGFSDGVNALHLFPEYTYGYGLTAQPGDESREVTEEWRRQLSAMPEVREANR